MKTLLLSLLSITLFISCEGEQAGESQGELTFTQEDITADLYGTYSVGCNSNVKYSIGNYHSTDIVIDAGVSKVIENVYQDSDCVGNHIATIEHVIVPTITATTSSEGAVSLELSIDVTETTFIPRHVVFATYDCNGTLFDTIDALYPLAASQCEFSMTDEVREYGLRENELDADNIDILNPELNNFAGLEVNRVAVKQ